jgi:hypothetical protein
MRQIFKTFFSSLGPLSNIGSFLILVLFMYALAGVIIFGEVKRNGDLNDVINFEKFGNAILTLFVMGTGDSWCDIGTYLMKRRSVDFDCKENPSYDDYVNNGY